MLSNSYLLFFNNLRVFRIHNTVTPTSAKTASSIVDTPSRVKISTNSFMPIAKIRF